MRYKILAVEDSKTLAEVLSFAFEKYNMEVVAVNNFDKAKELLTKENFDLILFDLNFKEINGIDFATHLRKELKNQTLLFLMAKQHRHEQKLKAKQAGVDGWIEKPFIAELLAKNIWKFLKYNR